MIFCLINAEFSLHFKSNYGIIELTKNEREELIMTYNVLRKQYLTKAYQKKQIEKYFGDRFVCFLNDKNKKYISFIVKDRIK